LTTTKKKIILVIMASVIIFAMASITFWIVRDLPDDGYTPVDAAFYYSHNDTGSALAGYYPAIEEQDQKEVY